MQEIRSVAEIRVETAQDCFLSARDCGFGSCDFLCKGRQTQPRPHQWHTANIKTKHPSLDAGGKHSQLARLVQPQGPV